MIRFIEMVLFKIRNAYTIFDDNKNIIGMVGFDGTFIPANNPGKRKSKQETMPVSHMGSGSSIS